MTIMGRQLPTKRLFLTKKYLILLITLLIFSCASTPVDPLETIRSRAFESISDPLTRQKYYDLLNDYQRLIKSYGEKEIHLHSRFIELNRHYNVEEEEVETLLLQAERAKKELRSAILDLEEAMKEILTPGEWKETRDRSLIILAEYYLDQEDSP